jgi:hypothetical protein
VREGLAVRRGTAVVLIAVALSAGFGCRRSARDAAPAASTPAPKPKPAVLVGSVMLEPGRDLPSYLPEQMERQVLAHVKGGTFPEKCTPPKTEDRQPVRLTADGKLIGVMLAASEFSQAAEPAPPHAHTLHIRDCRIEPRILLARIGDMLHIVNDTEFPMMPGIGSEAFNETLIFGQSRDLQLDTGGVKAVMCGFSSPCGRSDVIVMAHPYVAVTDEHGEFRIENFPADQSVHINAWHPLFHYAVKDVRVERGEEKRIELILTPNPPTPPPAPPVRDPNMIYPD